MSIKAGDQIRFKANLIYIRNVHHRYFGWNDDMQYVINLANKGVMVCSRAHNSQIDFTINGENKHGFTWHKDAFELVKTAEQLAAEVVEAAKAKCKFQVGEQVVRTERFTDSFKEGEVHQVERISDCGQYIWVGGYRGKTPAKYFDTAPVKGISPPPELTTFDEPQITAAPSTPDCGRVVGDNPSGCGLVARTEPKAKEPHAHGIRDKHEAQLLKSYIERVGAGDIPVTEIEHNLVAGVVLSGVPVEYYSIGDNKWHPVNRHTFTIAMIERTSFRAKPKVVDYYGHEIPAPVNPLKVTGRVYGVSLNNRKTYPCANATARSNHAKGIGLYWSCPEQAEAVLAILLKPFTEALK